MAVLKLLYRLSSTYEYKPHAWPQLVIGNANVMTSDACNVMVAAHTLFCIGYLAEVLLILDRLVYA